jgi:hypothetical protein
LQQLHEENEGRPDGWIIKEHKRCFTMWLKDQNLLVGEENMMGALVQGPSWIITTWQAYGINGSHLIQRQKTRASTKSVVSE